MTLNLNEFKHRVTDFDSANSKAKPLKVAFKFIEHVEVKKELSDCPG